MTVPDSWSSMRRALLAGVSKSTTRHIAKALMVSIAHKGLGHDASTCTHATASRLQCTKLSGFLDSLSLHLCTR
eukprot:5918575-Amphidinium_carterae.1